jgi:hypothetical protein
MALPTIIAPPRGIDSVSISPAPTVDRSGTTNVRSNLQALLDDAGNRYVSGGQLVTVDLGRGLYKIEPMRDAGNTPGLVMRTGVRLVGDGARIRYGYPAVATGVTGSITNGSTALTVSNASAIAVGDWIRVIGLSVPATGSFARVAGIAGLVVTLAGAHSGSNLSGANVYHCGAAAIFADNVDNWAIEGLFLEGHAHQTIQTTGGAVPGFEGAAIRVRDCSSFSVDRCHFWKFSRGILINSNAESISNIAIRNNTFVGGTNKTIASILDGSMTEFAGDFAYVNTGAIILDGPTGAPPANLSAQSIDISGNAIEVPGLDHGVSIMQFWNATYGVIAQNRIRGANAGIQVYAGSNGIPSVLPSVHRALSIHGNVLSALWTQGIYIRTAIGISVTGNQIHRAACEGADANTSSGGIVYRVNPRGNIASSTANTNLGHICSHNTIIDTGLASDGNLHSAIMVQHDHVLVSHNTILNTTDAFASVPSSASGNCSGIGVGQNVIGERIVGNRIAGFKSGVQIGNTLWRDNPRWECTGNSLATVNDGIVIDSYSRGGRVANNTITLGSTGIGVRVKRNPWLLVENNVVIGGLNAVSLFSGNFDTDLPIPANWNTGTSRSAQRLGSSLTVRGNQHLRRAQGATSFAVSETTANDSLFVGRCRELAGNTVDGVPFHYGLTLSATPLGLTTMRRTWSVGEVVWPSQTWGGAAVALSVTGGGGGTVSVQFVGMEIAVGGISQWHGASVNADLTNGSDTLTNMSGTGTEYFAVGQSLAMGAGFSGAPVVVEILSATSMRVDRNASSTTTTTCTNGTVTCRRLFGENANSSW